MSANNAERCFIQNRDMFNVQRDPEKWNLYNGLANLAQYIAELEREVQSLRQEVHFIALKIRG